MYINFFHILSGIIIKGRHFFEKKSDDFSKFKNSNVTFESAILDQTRLPKILLILCMRVPLTPKNKSRIVIDISLDKLALSEKFSKNI